MPSQQRQNKTTPNVLRAKLRKQRNRQLRRIHDSQEAEARGITVDELHRQQYAIAATIRRRMASPSAYTGEYRQWYRQW